MLPIKRQKHAEQRKQRNLKALQPERETALIHIILLNKAFRVVVLLFLAATVIPVFVYLLVFSREIGPLEYDRNQVGTCGHLSSLHVPCGISNITSQHCLERGCCYSQRDECYHSLPSRHQYYNPSYITPNLAMQLEPLRWVTPLGVPALPHMQLAIEAISDARARLRVWNPGASPIPVDAVNAESPEGNSTEYSYRIFQPVVYAEFRRKSDDSLLLTTSRGPLISAQNYLEWSFFLGTHHLFGLGDLHLQPGFRVVLLNNETTNAVPFILAHNATTQTYHGIYLSAPYPVEVEITESYLVIVRAIFSMSFHVEILCGPTIGHVMSQLSQVIEHIPMHLPSWFYGLHICDTNAERNLTESLSEMLHLLDVAQIARQPFDTHCIREHLLWLDDNDKAVEDDISSGVKMLRKNGKKFIAPVTALLEVNRKSGAFSRALDRGLLMRHPTIDEPYIGRVGNSSVAYVDWLGADETSLSEWLKGIWPTNISTDGYLLQSNWMPDESEERKTPRSFPYISEDMIDASRGTTPWLIRQGDTAGNVSIFSHNWVSSAQIYALRDILPNDTFIMSESSLFANVPITSRQTPSSWTELRHQVRRTMGQGISGVHFSSANICGDDETLSEELCVRWYQFASLSPMYRVASSKAPNKFSSFAERLIKASTLRRYSLLSYMQTVVASGRPLLTPMFYEFPHLVNTTVNLTQQVLVGPSLLFAPVLLPGALHINIFCPAVYYEIDGGQKLMANKWTQLFVVEADAPLFIRSGHIVPIHKSMNAMSITDVQTNSIQLRIAMGIEKNGIMTATGEVIVEEGQRVIFNATLRMQWFQFQLTSHPSLYCSGNSSITIESVKIYGTGFSDIGIQTLSRDVNHDLCKDNLNFITTLTPSANQ
ncbi:lysosomal alpha-glucosidase-like [Phlebotomus argentipes]|uniref:lysosomal alpha-glucosidase-like n=1 Tax=Phlebotomus argentipes TaxID=94469 RepID=UPI002892F262|nr:lysosomal alpha-glucosidase-like [Phlebotomus argentipes]